VDVLHITLHDGAIIVNDEATLKKEHAATNAMRKKAAEEIRVMMMPRRNRPNPYKNMNMVDTLTLDVGPPSLDQGYIVVGT
jgi:hypothetical protein